MSEYKLDKGAFSIYRYSYNDDYVDLHIHDIWFSIGKKDGLYEALMFIGDRGEHHARMLVDAENFDEVIWCVIKRFKEVCENI